MVFQRIVKEGDTLTVEFNNQASVGGVNFRRIEHVHSSEHILAEVAVIDKSHEVLQPLLYYLSSDQLEKEKLHSSHGAAFVMAGEVMAIDKGKKKVYLKNNITVCYKHLIVASGFKKDPSGTLHDEELASGLYALLEAIKIREKTSETLKFPLLSHLGFTRKNKDHQAYQVTIKGIPVDRLQKMINRSSSGWDSSFEVALKGTNKRLYEVVL